MAINKEIKVGRIVLPKSKMTDGEVWRGGVITKFIESTGRVCYTDRANRKNWVSRRKVAAVVDTWEEHDALLEFDKKALTKIGELKLELHAEYLNLFGKEINYYEIRQRKPLSDDPEWLLIKNGTKMTGGTWADCFRFAMKVGGDEDYIAGSVGVKSFREKIGDERQLLEINNRVVVRERWERQLEEVDG